MKNSRLVWIAVALLGIAGAVWGWWWRAGEGMRLIPVALIGAVAAESRQLILVVPEGLDAVSARVWLLERESPAERWRIIEGPWPANVGRNGTAWGRDGTGMANPGGYGEKQEGDGRSPAGVFRVPMAFGTAMTAPAGVKLPWLACTATLRGVDDVHSKYYNQIVDEAVIPDKDWNSAEVMRREDGLYDVGLVVGHNEAAVRGGGSCIFLHIWKGPGQGTAGCTALSEENVRKIAGWVDPAGHPRLVLGVR